MTDLRDELATNIDQDIAKELVEHYVELKSKFRLGDMRPAAQTAGLFCESAMKCLLYLLHGKKTSRMGLKFGESYIEIINSPKPSSIEEEYKFRLIPPVAKAVYDLRNKKWVAHARGEKLLYIDMMYIVQACDWILASLLFASHNVPEEKALVMMADIMTTDTPLVREIGKHIVLTTGGLTATEALLVLLYGRRGKESHKVIIDSLRNQWSARSANRAVQQACTDVFVFREPDTDTLHLLPNGCLAAERAAMKLQKSHVE